MSGNIQQTVTRVELKGIMPVLAKDILHIAEKAMEDAYGDSKVQVVFIAPREESDDAGNYKVGSYNGNIILLA